MIQTMRAHTFIGLKTMVSQMVSLNVCVCVCVCASVSWIFETGHTNIHANHHTRHQHGDTILVSVTQFFFVFCRLLFSGCPQTTKHNKQKEFLVDVVFHFDFESNLFVFS